MKSKCLRLFLLIMICFIFTSCNSSSILRKKYFNNFINITKLKYLDYEDLEYFYNYTSGFDTVGISYFVFSFKEEPTAFFLQFHYSNLKNKYTFKRGRDEEYEKKVIEKIDLLIGEKYSEIEEEYRLDFSYDYIYNEYPMFYFENSHKLYVVQYIT